MSKINPDGEKLKERGIGFLPFWFTVKSERERIRTRVLVFIFLIGIVKGLVGLSLLK